MKKIMLTMAGALLIGIVTVNAQEDTTKRTDPQQPTQQPAQEQPQDQYRSAELVPLPAAEIPATLKKTLEAPEYKGWENATIYQNKTTKEFVLEMTAGGTSKVYRFDRSGQPIKNDQPQPEGQ